MKPTIDLVYFDGCPHVDAAREALRAALDKTIEWREWRQDDPALPEYAAGYGSPTIFVGGREVTGAPATGTASACRVYRDAAGRSNAAPPAETIRVLVAAARR